MVQIWKFITLLRLISLTESSRIVPPLFRYDDYDRCHQEEDPTGVYCFVKVVFKEDRDPFDSPRIVIDFRHNLLEWGVCVNECQQELAKMDEEIRQSLFLSKFEINFTYIIPADLWDQYLDPFKVNYSEIINVCVNNRLKRDHNFDRLAFSEIEYCSIKDASGKLRRTVTWPIFTFYAIILTLVGLLIGANVVDWVGHDRIKEHIIVSSFSLQRNWVRLTEQSSSDLYQDFGYIDGVRVILSLWVMNLHILMVAGLIPMDNPEYIEEVSNNLFMINIASSCVVPVQIFFAISGLLLTTSIVKDGDQKIRFGIQYFWEKIINRLVRIAPVYYLFLLVSIVIPDIPGVQVSSIGYKGLILEQARCRKNWLTNVLFLNNLPSFSDEGCNLQGWYLAADQQLFIIVLLLVMICCKFPNNACSLLWSWAIIAVAIPIGIVCRNELESSLPIRLSDNKFTFEYQPWFKQMYLPSYSNFNCYIAGVIVGYIYHQHRYRKLNLKDNLLYKFIKRARLPLLALAYLPTFIFYRYEIPWSSWLTMIHTVLYRNVGVIAVCVTFIECFLNTPGFFRKFLSSKPMTSMGKLSYSVYVLQIPLVRFIVNWFPPTVEVKLTHLLWIGPSFVTVYLVGIIVYFCIEQPVSLLLKHYLLAKR